MMPVVVQAAIKRLQRLKFHLPDPADKPLSPDQRSQDRSASILVTIVIIAILVTAMVSGSF
jgi:hypothetical protein